MQTIDDYFENDSFKEHSETAFYRKGEQILGPYNNADTMYAIKSGLVKIYNYDSRGKENIAVMYGPGDFFPLAWIINQSRPSVFFQALVDCTIYLMPLKEFETMVYGDKNLCAAFMKRVVEQFALFASTINNLGLKYSRERLCYRLLVLAARYGEQKGGYTTIPYINQSDLAVTIKTTREGISKEISRLVKRGAIEYGRDRIIIKDPDFLQAEVGKGMPVIFFDNI